MTNDKMDERLAAIEARLKASLQWKPTDCEIETDDDGWVHAPQGAYLGDTLICLGDTYEEYQGDWVLCANAPADIAYLLAAVKDARREGMLAGMLEAAREVENFCGCTDDQATPEEIENHQCPAAKAIRKRASEL